MQINFLQNFKGFVRRKIKNALMKIVYKNAKEVLKKNKIVKLNLGCGTVYMDGWINIDNNSDENIKKLDLMWDLRKPLPFPENSIDFIFHEHFLEHLTVEEGQKLIKDCMRVLKKGGVMRIAMPDLAKCVNDYLNPNYLDENKEELHHYGLDFMKTNAEALNIDMRWWGHKWLYDWQELERRIKEAGCEYIKQCEIRQSEHEELKNLETRKASILIAEVTK